jgi:hypothetical protein
VSLVTMSHLAHPNEPGRGKRETRLVVGSVSGQEVGCPQGYPQASVDRREKRETRSLASRFRVPFPPDWVSHPLGGLESGGYRIDSPRFPAARVSCGRISSGGYSHLGPNWAKCKRLGSWGRPGQVKGQDHPVATVSVLLAEPFLAATPSVPTIAVVLAPGAVPRHVLRVVPAGDLLPAAARAGPHGPSRDSVSPTSTSVRGPHP